MHSGSDLAKFCTCPHIHCLGDNFCKCMIYYYFLICTVFLPIQKYYHARINHLAQFLNENQNVKFWLNSKVSEI